MMRAALRAPSYDRALLAFLFSLVHVFEHMCICVFLSISNQFRQRRNRKFKSKKPCAANHRVMPLKATLPAAFPGLSPYSQNKSTTQKNTHTHMYRRRSDNNNDKIVPHTSATGGENKCAERKEKSCGNKRKSGRRTQHIQLDIAKSNNGNLWLEGVESVQSTSSRCLVAPDLATCSFLKKEKRKRRQERRRSVQPVFFQW